MDHIGFLSIELENLSTSLIIANKEAGATLNTKGLVFLSIRDTEDVNLNNPIGDGIYMEDFRGQPYDTPIAVYIEVYNDPSKYMVFIPVEHKE
jgi:hypothetical protein